MENDEDEKNKMGSEYLGEGATKTTEVGFVIDDSCIFQAKFT